MVIYNELIHHVAFFCANCVIMVVICAFFRYKAVFGTSNRLVLRLYIYIYTIHMYIFVFYMTGIFYSADNQMMVK